MNILAIDFGTQRIGLAVGSTESGIAFTRPALENCCSVMDQLVQVMEQESIHQILLGLPLQKDGEPGSIDDALQAFASKLTQKTNTPIEWVNEQFSSKLADRKLKSLSMAKKKREEARKSGARDSMAAQVLLQEWLDEQ